MAEDLHMDFWSLSLNDDVQFEVTLDGVYQHISAERVKLLDRLARFQSYGYTTTCEFA